MFEKVKKNSEELTKDKLVNFTEEEYNRNVQKMFSGNQ